MRIPRIFHPFPSQALPAAGEKFPLSQSASAHLGKALRCSEGDRLTLFDGQGREYPAILSYFPSSSSSSSSPPSRSSHSKILWAALTDENPLSATELKSKEPFLQIHLLQALAKKEGTDFVLQKSVELGAARISLFFSERTEVRLEQPRISKKLQHWEGILQSAAEQCGRAFVPHLTQPFSLENLPDVQRGWGSEEFLKRRGETSKAGEESGVSSLLLHPQAEVSIAEVTPLHPFVRLLVGPEGGFSEQEALLAQQCGFQAVHLGPRILRTETAALVAMAALHTRTHF